MNFAVYYRNQDHDTMKLAKMLQSAGCKFSFVHVSKLDPEVIRNNEWLQKEFPVMVDKRSGDRFIKDKAFELINTLLQQKSGQVRNVSSSLSGNRSSSISYTSAINNNDEKPMNDDMPFVTGGSSSLGSLIMGGNMDTNEGKLVDTPAIVDSGKNEILNHQFIPQTEKITQEQHRQNIEKYIQLRQQSNANRSDLVDTALQSYMSNQQTLQPPKKKKSPANPKPVYQQPPVYNHPQFQQHQFYQQQPVMQRPMVQQFPPGVGYQQPVMQRPVIQQPHMYSQRPVMQQYPPVQYQQQPLIHHQRQPLNQNSFVQQYPSNRGHIPQPHRGTYHQ
jgi:hypothetical protein